MREEGNNCIGQVEKAIVELTEKMKELQEGLTAVYNEKVIELLEIKDYLARSIPVALEEVERTLAEEDPSPYFSIRTFAQRVYREARSTSALHVQG